MLRLLSTPMFHTPGIIRWAQCGYETGNAEQMMTMMMDGYHLTEEFARKLLAGEVEWTEEESDGFTHVVIDVDPATATTKFPSVS